MEYGEDIIRIVSALDLYVTQEIKKRRKQLNISQMELSVDMGFSEKLIGNMENLAFNSKFSIRHLNLAAKVKASHFLDNTKIDKIRFWLWLLLLLRVLIVGNFGEVIHC